MKPLATAKINRMPEPRYEPSGHDVLLNIVIVFRLPFSVSSQLQTCAIIAYEDTSNNHRDKAEVEEVKTTIGRHEQRSRCGRTEGRKEDHGKDSNCKKIEMRNY